jgi:hypothetical protein
MKRGKYKISCKVLRQLKINQIFFYQVASLISDPRGKLELIDIFKKSFHLELLSELRSCRLKLSKM